MKNFDYPNVELCGFDCPKISSILPLCFPLTCDQKKSPNVYKNCPKMISLEKLIIMTPLQKLPKNVRDLGKLIAAKGFKKWPKVQ